MLPPQVEPDRRQSFELAGAGATLGGVTAGCIAAGVLIGWAAGSVGLGALAGTVVGLPAGVYSIYRRYKGYFTG